MKAKKTQYDLQLESWARRHNVETLIQNQDIFVSVDKYNNPVLRKSLPKSRVSDVPSADRSKLEKLKENLPYETQYFRIAYDKKHDLFLITKKTPIQSMLNVWAVVIILWALYRWYFRTTLPIWVDEFIAKPLVFILPIYYYVTKIEKKRFLEGVSLQRFLSPQQLVTGIVIGLVFFVTGILSLYFKHGNIAFKDMFTYFPLPLWLIVLVSLATSISEEIVSRGFVLKRLYEDSKNIYTSSLYTSILFFIMHIPILLTNDQIVGAVLLQIMFTDVLFSLAVSLIFIETKNLYLAILIHAFYSFSLYLFSSV